MTLQDDRFHEAVKLFKDMDPKKSWVQILNDLIAAHSSVFRYHHALMCMNYVSGYLNESSHISVDTEDFEQLLQIEKKYPSVYFIDIYETAYMITAHKRYQTASLNLCVTLGQPALKRKILQRSLISLLEVSFTDKTNAAEVLGMLDAKSDIILNHLLECASSERKRMRRVAYKSVRPLGPPLREEQPSSPPKPDTEMSLAKSALSV